MESEPERLERLVLATDELVQATVAWDAIVHASEEAKGLSCWAPGLWYDPKLWMLAAGLSKAQAKPIAKRLRSLSFISPEGVPWTPVLQLARSMAAKRLSTKPPKGRR